MNDKNIYLILGASSDIGTALLERLNNDKEESLFICHYHSSREEIERIMPRNNNRIVCLRIDFTNPSEVRASIKEIRENYGTPTHIIHLPAGKFEYTRFKKFDWERFQLELEIQVHAFVDILQAFLPSMIKNSKKAKVVIMLTTCTVSSPPKNMMNYIMAKYTLLGLMKSLSADYAGKNVCINAVSPSMTETKFWDGIDSRLVEQNAEKNVGGRIANVSDIVPAILFLLSEGSDYIHGINLNISNGNIL